MDRHAPRGVRRWGSSLVGWGALTLVACGLALVGCNALWGVDDLDYASPGVGTAGASAGGSGGHAGQGAAGGHGGTGASAAGTGGTTTASCVPGASEACYTGPEDTRDVGACRAGLWVCNELGTGFGPCQGQVLPSAEICGNATDEDCNHELTIECLTSEGLVARYFMDEATTGQLPTAVQDSAPNPLPLPITYSATLSYGESDGNAGLYWNAASTAGHASIMLEGTKIYDALHNACALTLELVVDLTDTRATGSHLGRFGQAGTSTARLVLDSEDVGLTCGLEGGESCGQWPFTMGSGRKVLQLVYDCGQPQMDDRVRLHVDGQLVHRTAAPQGPLAGEVVDLTGCYFGVGNRPGGSTSPRGWILYAALYARALEPVELVANAERLLASDDSP